MGQRRIDRQWPKPTHVHHVWVKQEDWHYPPLPGLVLEWRRHSYQWWALVLVVEQTDGKPPVATQRWMLADRLIPIKSDPNQRSSFF